MEETDALSKLDAEEDWNRARRKILYQKLVCFFKQCSVDLLSFEDVRSRLQLVQKLDRGLQEVPLERIRGSVGRFDDFTSAYLPRKRHLQDRWERVDVAMKAGKTPPIEVYQVGESYFVLDGNHRVSVARQLDLKKIEAYVCEFPTPVGLSPEADIDEVLIKSEQVNFLGRIGGAAPPAVREIAFTCPDCYGDLVEMIETYRHGLDETNENPVTFEDAVSAWYEEVYGPCLEIIQNNDLLAQFSSRTEADLFIWAWKNNKILEEFTLEDEKP
ncbi:MAG: ParB N-terminal domain-containing protein [Anaerolineales bacterium]|nr:MAG: ParB N-terminal domain-containing protein [Anaerolineales bacterium]